MASGANLGKLPIIDSRGYDEQGIHYIWRSFAERARIDAANGGNHGNQVMWRYGTGLLPATPAQFAAVTLNSLLTMDVWLSNLTVSAPKATLNSVRSQAQVIQAKPATAFDLCYLTGDTTFSAPVTDPAVCDADPRLAKHASPRQVAGGHARQPIMPRCCLGLRSGRDWKPHFRMASATGASRALASSRRFHRSILRKVRAACRCRQRRCHIREYGRAQWHPDSCW